MKNFLNRFGFKGAAVAVFAIMLASPALAHDKKVSVEMMEEAGTAVDAVIDSGNNSVAVPYEEIIRRHEAAEDAENKLEVPVAIAEEQDSHVNVVESEEAIVSTLEALDSLAVNVDDFSENLAHDGGHLDESHADGEHGGGLPQLDPKDWPSQIFWLLVFFSLTYFFASRLIVPSIGSILEARDNRISDDLDKARTVKNEAEEVKSSYEASITKAREDARAEIKTMQDEVAKLTAEREASFAEESADRMSDAEKRIAAAKADAMTKVEDIAAEISVDITNKLAGLSLADKDATGAIKDSLEAEMV